MASLRTIYLMLVVVCLGGTFVLEQPRNSNMEFYPMFVEFLYRMYDRSDRKSAVPLLDFIACVFPIYVF